MESDKHIEIQIRYSMACLWLNATSVDYTRASGSATNHIMAELARYLIARKENKKLNVGYLESGKCMQHLEREYILSRKCAKTKTKTKKENT